MLTTHLPTWCCHQEEDDDLSNLDDQDDSDPEDQGNIDERLTDHNEFHKHDDVMTRDDTKDLDSVMVAFLNIKDNVTARVKMKKMLRRMKMMMRRKKVNKLHRIATLHICTALSLSSSVCDLSRVLICKTK